jgi:hypothetical protein
MTPALFLLLLAQAPAQELRPLFDGLTLAGWRGRPHLNPAEELALAPDARAELQAQWNKEMQAHWRVENGEIVNDGDGPFLTTEAEFGDAEFQLDYKTVPLADSGIYLRATPQVQIWDWTEAGGKWELGADKGSGGLWNNERHPRFPSRRVDAAFGDWNRLRIRMIGERTWVWLNGAMVVPAVPLENYWDRSLPLHARGPLQLQTHGGEIRFRKLAAREIGAAEANTILLALPPEIPLRRGETPPPGTTASAFAPVFDGKTWTGWSGPTDGWEISAGAMRCRPGQGGTIYTSKEYADFSARFEFRLPPGGNNGLAIRYPGEGDTAYVGMCELQVLDNEAEQYASLQPWQFHGSAYGQVPARRGFLRPAGTWNCQTVTVVGGRVQVELNGTVILDTDLWALEHTADGHDHPGRLRKSGHFGFAGHGDAVEFRSIQIREL